MPKYRINVSMDARVHGHVNIEGASRKEALSNVNKSFLYQNFETEGKARDWCNFSYDGIDLYNSENECGEEVDEIYGTLPDDEYNFPYLTTNEAALLIKALQMMSLVDPSDTAKRLLDRLLEQKNHIEANQGN